MCKSNVKCKAGVRRLSEIGTILEVTSWSPPLVLTDKLLAGIAGPQSKRSQLPCVSVHQSDPVCSSHPLATPLCQDKMKCDRWKADKETWRLHRNGLSILGDWENSFAPDGQLDGQWALGSFGTRSILAAVMLLGKKWPASRRDAADTRAEQSSPWLCFDPVKHGLIKTREEKAKNYRPWVLNEFQHSLKDEKMSSPAQKHTDFTICTWKAYVRITAVPSPGHPTMC